MKRYHVWFSTLMVLLLVLAVGTAAADTIRQGTNGAVLANGTEVTGVWSNKSDEFLTLTRAGDFADNAGIWYPTGKGGSYTLQLRAGGEYQ